MRLRGIEMSKWASNSVKRSHIGGRSGNMVALPEKPITKEMLEMAKKECKHLFVYFDDGRSILPGNRKALVVDERPQPDVYVAHRLPYCPLCGEKHKDVPAKFEE